MKLRALPIGTLFAAALLLLTARPAAAAAPTPSLSPRRPVPVAPPAAAPAQSAASAAATTRTAAVVADVVNPGFEMGDLTGWQFDPGFSDVKVIPKDPPDACFQPEMPSEGEFMACMSTGTFFGGASNGGLRSDLTSGPITFDFRPGSIKVSFDVDFQTEESERSIGHNDAFEARLVTNAGTFVMVQLDTFGRTTPGRGLRVVGFDDLQGTQPNCDIIGLRTGRLTVTWTKPFDPVLRGLIGRGPVFVEFTISHQGDLANRSVACVDDVKVRVTKP